MRKDRKKTEHSDKNAPSFLMPTGIKGTENRKKSSFAFLRFDQIGLQCIICV